MSLEWIHEGQPAHWDDAKARIVGAAGAGIFDARYGELSSGQLIPGEWWRVEDDGRVVGYGWLDIVWGDAEIQLATDTESRGKGVGAFTLQHLESEAARRGLGRVYNIVRPTHPDRDDVSAWLSKRGFEGNEDGTLFRAVSPSTR